MNPVAHHSAPGGPRVLASTFLPDASHPCHRGCVVRIIRERAEGRRFQRRCLAAAIAVAIAATPVACSDDGEEVRAGETIGGADEGQAVIVEAIGPALAGADGGRVVVWGGRPSSDPAGESLAEGWIVDTGSGERSATVPAPFDTPVGNPRAAGAGGLVLVVAQACEDWTDVDPGRQCRPGDAVGAVLDVAQDTWAPLGGDDLATVFSTPVTVDASSAGTALVSSPARPDALVTVDLANSAATVLAAPPLNVGPDPDPGTVSACVTNTDVVVVERTAPPGFDADADTTTAARVHLHGLDSAAWRTIEDPAGIWDPVLTCTDDGALVTNGVGVSFGAAWLSTPDGTWTQLEAPTGDPAPYSVRVRDGDAVLLFDGTATRPGLTLDPPSPRFVEIPGEPQPFDCDHGQCVTTTGDAVAGANRPTDTPAATRVFWFPTP